MKQLVSLDISKFITTHFKIFIILLAIAHIAIKFAYIGQESLYTDEPYSVFIAQQSLSQIFAQSLQDSNPPLYLFLLHIWITIFGMSAIAVKSLSIVASIATGVMIALFAKKFLNVQTAVFGSVLFLLSNVQLYYSHEARTYALLGLFVVCSFYVFLSLLHAPSKKKLVILAIINVSILFLHYTVIYMHVVQALVALLYFKKFRKGFWYYGISQGLALLLFVPWIQIVLQNTPTGKGWIQPPSFGMLKYVVFTLSNTKKLFFIFSGVLVVFIGIYMFRRKQWINENFDKKKWILLLLWFVLPISLNYIVSQTFPSFLVRTVLFANIGLLLLVAYTISSLTIHKSISIIAALYFVAVFVKQVNLTQERPEHWNTLVPQVIQQKHERTAIIVAPWWHYMSFTYYYNIQYFKDYQHALELMNKEQVYFVNERSNLTKFDFSNVDTIILIKCRPPINDIDSLLLNKGYHEHESKKRADISIQLFVKPIL